MTYAGMGAPEPNFDWLLSHPSRLPNQTWESVFNRACYHEDDGHMCKMIRVMKHAQEVSKPYDHLPEFKVKQNMFLPAAIAAIDSGSKQPMEWTKHFDFIRGAGYAEAWEKVPLREERIKLEKQAQEINGHAYGTKSESQVHGLAVEQHVNGVNGHADKKEITEDAPWTQIQMPERPNGMEKSEPQVGVGYSRM